MVKTVNMLILSIIVFIVGCSSTMPLPTPPEHRILCVITEFVDLTGSYAVIDPKFEEIFYNEIQKDYFTSYEKPSSGQGYTLVLTNMFEPVNISEYENLRKDSLHTGTQSSLLIKGSVEQITYGTVNDIKNYVIDVWFFGFWGLILSNPKDSSRRAGLVEYKITLHKLPENEIIDTIILQGVYIHEPDRKKIIHSANILAAQRLAYKLNSKIAKTFGVTPQSRRFRGDKVIVY